MFNDFCSPSIGTQSLYSPDGRSTKNLYIELVRNRTKTLYLVFGYLQYSGPSFLISDNPLPRVDYYPPNWVVTDISAWRFSFIMSQWNSAQLPPTMQPALVYDPLVNISDPTTGFLTWNIQGVDLVMPSGNYNFEMTVCSDGSTVKSLCSGVAALLDNLKSYITVPSTQLDSPFSVLCNSIVNFTLRGFFTPRFPLVAVGHSLIQFNLKIA